MVLREGGSGAPRSTLYSPVADIHAHHGNYSGRSSSAFEANAAGILLKQSGPSLLASADDSDFEKVTVISCSAVRARDVPPESQNDRHPQGHEDDMTCRVCTPAGYRISSSHSSVLRLSDPSSVCAPPHEQNLTHRNVNFFLVCENSPNL